MGQAITSWNVPKRRWQHEKIHERSAVMSAALTVVTPCVNYLLIYVARMGIDGAALANNVEAALYCAMLLTYFIVKERGLVKSGRHTWHGWCAALPEQCWIGASACPVHSALKFAVHSTVVPSSLSSCFVQVLTERARIVELLHPSLQDLIVYRNCLVVISAHAAWTPSEAIGAA